MTELNELSEREKEILRLVATGASNKEIAQSLYISANTVKVHLRNIFAKIGAATRTEAAMFAVQAGLVAGASQPSEALNPVEPAPEDVLLPPEVAIPATIPVPWYQRRLFLVGGLIVVILLALAAGRWFLPAGPATAQVTPAPTFQARWQSRGAIPQARKGMAAVAYANMIYLLAGESNEGVVGTVEKYDPGAETWETLPGKPTAVTDVRGVVLGGRVYLPGGRLAGGEISSVLEIFDLQANRWHSGAPLLEPRSGYALAAIEGNLYLFGGWDGKTYRAEVYEYDPDVNAWSRKSAMPTARAFAGAAVIGDRIFVSGGENLGGLLSVTEIYQPVLDDGSGGSWSSGVSLPEPRTRFGMAGIADIIYVIGGDGESSEPLPSLEYFSEQAVWQAFEIPIEQTWQDFGIATVGSNLFGVGGQMGGNVSDEVWSYKAIYTLSIPLLQGSDQ